MFRRLEKAAYFGTCNYVRQFIKFYFCKKIFFTKAKEKAGLVMVEREKQERQKPRRKHL